LTDSSLTEAAFANGGENAVALACEMALLDFKFLRILLSSQDHTGECKRERLALLRRKDLVESVIEVQQLS
jgi:hypothetical protein